LLALVLAWTRGTAAWLRFILRYASSPLHAVHTLGTPVIVSKTPIQSNRHSRYDNAQHCALSAAYKKHGCTILTKKRCALKNIF